MERKIAIIFGGKSAEHEVSLASATNICNAMDCKRFTPVLLGIDKKGEWCYDKEYPTTGVNLVKNDYFSKAEHVYLSSSKSHIQVIEKKSNRVLADFDVVFPIVH